MLSQNPQIKGMLPAGAEEYVSILQRDWRALPVHVPSRCAYEKQETHGIRIVDEASASALCDGPVDPIEADHIGIVKPKDMGDLSYLALRQVFQSTGQNSPTLSSTNVAPTPPVSTGALIGTRVLNVTCGQQAERTEQILIPTALKPEQRLVDAVVSLQQGTNLKEQQVELTGRTEFAARVHYQLVGLDRNASGGCAGEGSATLVVAFLVSQIAPPVLTKGRPQMQIRQRTKGDMSAAIAGVQGNVTIVHNAEPEETAAPPAAHANMPAGLNPLELATTPALHGILIEQFTQGKLSPAITGVSGDVVFKERAKAAQQKR